MRFLTFSALFLLGFGVFIVPQAQAEEGAVHNQDPEGENVQVPEEDPILTLEEAKMLIATRRGAKDATSEVVKDFSLEFYDLYSRQLQYRENAKEFRAMLETRRYSYQRPYVETRDDFNYVRRKVYEAEREAYQAEIEALNKALSAQAVKNDEQGIKKDENIKKVSMPAPDEPVKDYVGAESEGREAGDDAPGIQERDIPQDETAKADAGNKKVIVPADAPDFDPADL